MDVLVVKFVFGSWFVVRIIVFPLFIGEVRSSAEMGRSHCQHCCSSFLLRFFIKGTFITKTVAVVAFNQRKSWYEMKYWSAPPPRMPVTQKDLMITFFGSGIPKPSLATVTETFSQVLLCILGVLYGCDAWTNHLLKADVHYVLMSGPCNNTFGQSNAHYDYYIPTSYVFKW